MKKVRHKRGQYMRKLNDQKYRQKESMLSDVNAMVILSGEKTWG